MKPHLKYIAAALIAAGTTNARAQGIPVMDIASIIQSILQVLNEVTQIENQIQQITQMGDQLKSLNGIRNLGDVFDNPMLKNYVPAEAYTYLNAINSSGYAALNATAKSLRDASMVYNCLDLSGASRTNCQASLAQPYQQKGLLQDAMKSASGRLSQIKSLMNQINGTSDQKAVQEIQARIGAENALLAHEVSQVQMLQGMADSEERIARSRERERQYEMLARTGKLADYLH
jgi:type IV secretion system protein VirB5